MRCAASSQFATEFAAVRARKFDAVQRGRPDVFLAPCNALHLSARELLRGQLPESLVVRLLRSVGSWSIWVRNLARVDDFGWRQITLQRLDDIHGRTGAWWQSRQRRQPVRQCEGESERK